MYLLYVINNKQSQSAAHNDCDRSKVLVNMTKWGLELAQRCHGALCSDFDGHF